MYLRLRLGVLVYVFVHVVSAYFGNVSYIIIYSRYVRQSITGYVQGCRLSLSSPEMFLRGMFFAKICVSVFNIYTAHIVYVVVDVYIHIFIDNYTHIGLFVYIQITYM